MREDVMEYLNKAFPKGFVIVYVNPNDSVRAHVFNPRGSETLEEAAQKIIEMSDKPEDWKER